MADDGDWLNGKIRPKAQLSTLDQKITGAKMNRQWLFLQLFLIRLIGSMRAGSVVLFQGRMSFFSNYRSFENLGAAQGWLRRRG
jgi:hypothetical protein